MRGLFRKHLARLLAGGAGTILILILSATAQGANADGSEIAYITNDHRSIHLVQPDGSGDRQLLAVADLLNLAWAPDGKVLAYSTGQLVVNPPPTRTYLLDVASGRSTELKSSVPTRGPIAFFPDGTRLATTSNFRSVPGEGFNCEHPFLAIELPTGRAMPIGQAGCVGSLQVAPDGAALIVSECGGAPACWVYSLALPSGDKSNIAQASPEVPFAAAGVASPDNRSVAYFAHRGFGADSLADLVLADRDGSNPRAILQGLFENLATESVAFSADGTQLALARSDPGVATAADAAAQIWVIGTDGTSPKQIATGYEPAWRPGTVASSAAATGTVSEPTGAAQPPSTSRPPTTSPGLTGGQCRESQGAPDGSSIHSECDNGVGYVFDFAGRTVSMYDPAKPDGGTTSGPLPLTQRGLIGWDWVNPDGAACEYVSTAHIATVECKGGGVSSAPAQGATPPAAASPPQESAPVGAPAVLTENVQTDILAAVDRANVAWTAAGQLLDASSLDGNVAGQALSDDRAELDKLRSQAHTQTNVNTAFSVVDVTLDAPGHAIVRTRETWYAEIHAAATGQLIQRTSPSTYQETYIVEYQGDGWIVTRNDIS